MKDEPTEIDREAALLFTAAPGMRVIADHDWVRVATDDYGLHENHACATDAHSSCGVAAIDTDDPATVGVMLAQVMEADSGPMGYIRPHRRNPWSAEAPAFAYYQSDTLARHFGTTAGAAIVAAMKALKGVA